MAFKLAIGDIIDFPVHLKLRDGGSFKDFKFSLLAKRIDSAQANELMTSGTTLGDLTIDEFLREKVTGWRGQALVLTEDNQPAPYSVEAFSSLQELPGASLTMYQAYLNAVVASNGAKGVQKN
ncbi:hypothetical protein KIH07_16790 [Hydrogenophaga taeniospiralis]|uniref:hypothetical protein n=1 Tax=Hydrogenophaga taeniospiralis TaxID=65656 RepID=UPI001CF9EAA8|nr:hypothetical protein [Hydrogenophaga taeniospiralis]MCB4365402.1 hypothetical protein [Hydrogenophaga taeniospiralis]